MKTTKKSKREMFQHGSEKAPVTFQDVAACFSEEDWKLLHEWQKELYKNVMKEIHQALISLGPVIATSVFSLRATEKEHLSPAHDQDSERRDSKNRSPSATISNSDVLRLSREEKQNPKDPKVTDRRERSDHLDTGHEATLPIISFCINKEGETYALAHHGSERRENSSHAGFPSLNTEAEAGFLGHLGAEGAESNTSASSGQEVVTTVVSSSIKEERAAYFMDHQDSVRKESKNILTGVNTSVNSMEKRASSWDRTSLNSECGRNFSPKLDVLSHHKIKAGETFTACTEYGSSPNHRSDPAKHKKAHTGQLPYTRNECGKRESATLSPDQKINTALKVYICSQCGNCFSPSENETVHHQINKGEQQNTCSECEKTLCLPTSLNKDQGRHMGEKPYACRECGKSFGKARALMIHQRVHTGEKPFTCSQCGKDFRQLPHLVVHQRLHTGEKPYICNVCDRRFIDSSNLRRHQQIHTREMETVTWTTEG